MKRTLFYGPKRPFFFPFAGFFFNKENCKFSFFFNDKNLNENCEQSEQEKNQDS